MSRSLPRPAVSLAVLAASVLVAGIGAAWAIPAEPAAARPVASTGQAAPPSPVPAPAVVELAVSPAVVPPPPYDPGDPATWTSRQLAAQLVFSCVQTTDLGTANAHAAAGLGGIALLGRPTDGPALAAGLAGVRGAAPHGIAPMVASDEEGGLVQRLKGILGPLPSATEMGSWPDAQIEQTAHDYAAGMRALGVSMALSPVADLGVPGGYPAQTRRTFAGDPARVAGAAVAWSRGLERAGVVSVVKHWPGHGHAGDSHTAAPAVPALPALAPDLLPFDTVLGSGVGVVMVGHLLSEGLTEPGVPATLSPNAMRVLRERAGPDTVVLTDSLSMAASSSALGLRPADAAVRALQAGADWAMSCVDPLIAVDAVQAALDTGGLAREGVVASARRVLALKQRQGLLAVPLASAPPTGAVETASSFRGVVRLTGRAADPDTPEPPRLRVLVGGRAVHEQVADVATGRFAISVLVGAGSQACVEAVESGSGRPTPLGCVTAPG